MKFRVGDRVMVRPLADMAARNYVDEGGNIWPDVMVDMDEENSVMVFSNALEFRSRIICGKTAKVVGRCPETQTLTLEYENIEQYPLYQQRAMQNAVVDDWMLILLERQPPRRMTKTEIENELGYSIEIVD